MAVADGGLTEAEKSVTSSLLVVRGAPGIPLGVEGRPSKGALRVSSFASGLLRAMVQAAEAAGRGDSNPPVVTDLGGRDRGPESLSLSLVSLPSEALTDAWLPPRERRGKEASSSSSPTLGAREFF